MISLPAMEHTHASHLFRSPSADDKVSRVLDCAEFLFWRISDNGDRQAVFLMRKAIPGAPVGALLTLAELHEKLFSNKAA